MSEQQKSASVRRIAGTIFLGLLAAWFLIVVAPKYITSRNVPSRNPCINNLRQIDGGKQQWALDNHKDTNAIPTRTDVAQYLKDNNFPDCPDGGTYTLGRDGEDPTCSIPGHVLPTP